MEIPEPPDRPICSGCNELLVWLYSARKARWVGFIVLTGHRLQPHLCDQRIKRLPSPDPTIIRRNRRGRALATALIAAGPNTITEETRP